MLSHLTYSDLESKHEEVFLSLQTTAHGLLQAFARRLRSADLTPTQYNVLRILRGVHPESLSCSEIGRRMVAPVPDVTRLLDRLETRGAVYRRRDQKDRRVVTARISVQGLDLLAVLDTAVRTWYADLLGQLAEDEIRDLLRLLGRARGGG